MRACELRQDGLDVLGGGTGIESWGVGRQLGKARKKETKHQGTMQGPAVLDFRDFLFLLSR